MTEVNVVCPLIYQSSLIILIKVQSFNKNDRIDRIHTIERVDEPEKFERL